MPILYAAIDHAAVLGEWKCLEPLLDEPIIDQKCRQGTSLVDRLMDLQSLRILEIAREKGHDFSTKREDGSTLLHRIQAHTNLDLVQFLLSSGLRLDDVTVTGLSPLHRIV